MRLAELKVRMKKLFRVNGYIVTKKILPLQLRHN